MYLIKDKVKPIKPYKKRKEYGLCGTLQEYRDACAQVQNEADSQ
jgi:hypothetical protein